jgi:hypothetical protein
MSLLSYCLHLIFFKMIIILHLFFSDILRPLSFFFCKRCGKQQGMEASAVWASMKKRRNPNSHICCYAREIRMVSWANK